MLAHQCSSLLFENTLKTVFVRSASMLKLGLVAMAGGAFRHDAVRFARDSYLGIHICTYILIIQLYFDANTVWNDIVLWAVVYMRIVSCGVYACDVVGCGCRKVCLGLVECELRRCQ